MADDKKLSLSDIFKNLLSCSDEQSNLEKTIHVYDPKELQTGWRTVSCNVNYVACPSIEREDSPSQKSDSSKKKNKKAKAKEEQEIGCKYDKFKSLGVLSYDVPSWRTIIDPETCTYVQRQHPCSFTSTGHKVGDLRGLTFVDPAGVLDQHLGGFVQRQRARFQPGYGSNVLLQRDLNARSNFKHIHQLNGLYPILEEKPQSLTNNLIPQNSKKVHTLKPLPSKPLKDNLPKSNIAISKNPPPVQSQSTIDRKTGRLHHEVLQSQKIKLAPFKPPIMPANFVQPLKRKQKQKLNWLPITTSPCLPQTTGQSGQKLAPYGII